MEGNIIKTELRNDTTNQVGSIWRKWDLHVHSPASSGFKGDWNQFIIQLGNADCDVIGINDYFSVTGYKEVLKRLNDPDEASKGNQAYRDALEKLRIKILLPVVECRMNNIVISKHSQKSGTRINFHIIFDNSLSPDDIENAIKSFKVNDEKISSHYNDSIYLLNDAAVDYFATINELKSEKTLRNSFLIWLPYDEYGGADEVDPVNDRLFKQRLINNANIIGSSNKNQIDFFLWKNQKFTEQQYKDWFGKKLPCIKGSDSHDSNDEIGQLKDSNSKPVNKFCWIKADPTFEGLKQICNEPEDRINICDTPDKIKTVTNNSTNYLSHINISKVGTISGAREWFDNDIPLNFDMVAIIGNKGEGKSALTDIMATACNTHCLPKYFSFLTSKRFREKNGKFASNFIAEVTWADGSKDSIQLDQDPDLNKIEKVKYIPQTYLDSICTETSSDEFQKELRSIIFSHIPEDNRLGHNSLEDLIHYHSEELEQQLDSFRSQISRINTEIIGVEIQLTPETLTKLLSEKKELEQKISAHKKGKPKEVSKPSEPTKEEQKKIDAVNKQIKAVQTQIELLENRIESAVNYKKAVTERIALARKLRTKLEGFEKSFEQLKDDTADDFRILSLNIPSTISLTLNLSSLENKIGRLSRQEIKAGEYLSESGTRSLVMKKQQLAENAEKLQETLDAPNKKYQAYLKDLREWEKILNKIEGDKKISGTLKYVEEQIRAIKNDLPNKLKELEIKRSEQARNLFAQIEAIRQIYNQLFKPVQDLIANNALIKDELGLSFDSSIMIANFISVFFGNYISQGKTGTFMGKVEGSDRLERLIEGVDFGKIDEVIVFAEEITKSLKQNLRDEKQPFMRVEDQLRKDVLVQGVYDFIWSFDYLKPQYALKLDDKYLTQLSPGERGTLLLIFYLLVDKSEYPIIVDQPEENLDSQTVYTLLKPVIKDVKRRRQIIMVTHHPNIAVACDAEQIIYCEIDRKNSYKVNYLGGAIESPQMNSYVVDVLEGTRPAFDNRDAKYQNR